jgi:hypothetical protein
MTRRGQLIAQMRAALNDLQSPAYFDYNETLPFTIADMDFEFDSDSLYEVVEASE